MKQLLLSLSLSLTAIFANAQNFENTYNYGIGTSIYALTEGDYVASVNYPNYGILRLDADGTEKGFTAINYATVQSVLPTVEGGFVFTGMNRDDQNAIVVKTDANGDSVWTKTFPAYGFSATAAEITQMSDSGFIINMSSDGSLSSNPYQLVRIDKNGNILWTNLIGDAKAKIHSFTVSNNYLFDAFTTSYHDEVDIIRLAKINANTGNTEWTSFLFDTTYQTIGFPCNSYIANSSVVVNGLEMVVAGSKTLKLDPMTGTSYQFIFKTDANGNIVWEKTFAEGEFTQIINTSDNGFTLIGKTANNVGFTMMKLDANGNSLWSYSFNKGTESSAKSVQQTTDNGFVVSGLSYDATANSYLTYVVKTDEQGQVSNLMNGISNQPVSVNETMLYPNVLVEKSTLHINMEEVRKGVVVTIYDITGKAVSQINVTSEYTEIFKGNLQAGTYMLGVSNGAVAQFIVE